jgi:hypothetical protein
MRFDAGHMRSATQGRWASFILPALGIDVPHNPRKHGPCPFCGGKDRFRFDDQDGRGTWFCNQCDPQAGDGFALVMKMHRCTFPEALQLVAEILGIHSTAHAKAHRPLPPAPVRIDRLAVAFQFELGALDLRLRAERIIEAGKGLHVAGLNDDEIERVIGHMAKAHADIERAELYEDIADALRTREFNERMSCEQRQRVA